MIELTGEKNAFIKGPDASNLVWLVLDSGSNQTRLSFPADSIAADALVSWRDEEGDWEDTNKGARRPSDSYEQVEHQSDRAGFDNEQGGVLRDLAQRHCAAL